MQIDTVLTYCLHKNDENARGKRSLPNPQLKADTCKNGATNSSYKLQNDCVAENDSILANVHVVSRGLQSHDRHVLVLISHCF